MPLFGVGVACFRDCKFRKTERTHGSFSHLSSAPYVLVIGVTSDGFTAAGKIKFFILIYQ
jgi:hypothetical protein